MRICILQFQRTRLSSGCSHSAVTWMAMDNFKKLFVAIDFSPASDEALREAHDRAKLAGAQLAVCHIVPNELRSNVLFPQDTRSAALQFPLEMKKTGEAA